MGGIGKIHYIIILDDSGSMTGQPWNDLMNAFKNFLRILETNPNQKENSKITCINHNESAILYF